MSEYEKRAMIEAEDKYTFRQSSQISGQTGLIGYLRADMDTDGNGFFASWNDWRKDLKTDEFKAEFDEVINSLREEGDILHNRKALASYCYLIPDLEAPESPKVGKYGMLRRAYLREHKDGIYTGMMLDGTLNRHLEEVDAQANRMMEELTEQLKVRNGVNEQMKAEDQMKWVGLMNSIRHSAEEVVLRDLIYA